MLFLPRNPHPIFHYFSCHNTKGSTSRSFVQLAQSHSFSNSRTDQRTQGSSQARQIQRAPSKAPGAHPKTLGLDPGPLLGQARLLKKSKPIECITHYVQPYDFAHSFESGAIAMRPSNSFHALGSRASLHYLSSILCRRPRPVPRPPAPTLLRMNLMITALLYALPLKIQT